jgi:hypothetical protein
VDNGMLTANGKMKREVIAGRLSAEIERMYQSLQNRDREGAGAAASG